MFQHFNPKYCCQIKSTERQNETNNESATANQIFVYKHCLLTVVKVIQKSINHVFFNAFVIGSHFVTYING